MLHIELNREDLSNIYNAITQLELTAKEIKENFALQCAMDMQIELVNAIISQKYAGQYEKLSEVYSKWKLKEVGFLDFWRLYSDLLNSIGIFKVGTESAWAAGVLPGTVSQKGDSIEHYGSINEEVRPLFKPVTEEYTLTGWQKRMNEALDKIGKAWQR